MSRIFLLLLAGVTAFELAAAHEPVDGRLVLYRRLLGRTWRAELPDSTGRIGLTEVARWERALNGKAVRALHSVNNGQFGGEMLITWDSEKKGLVFFYVTTAGFYTTGTVEREGNAIVTIENLRPGGGGINQVRTTLELRPDGTLRKETRYLEKGKWVQGKDVIYREDPAAKVVFH